MAALEKKKERDQLHGEIETAHPGYLGAQDTFYVGTLKGVGRIYEQTFIDTYAKVSFTKLYTMKTPLTAADLLNDQVLPFFEEHPMGLLGVLTDRGTEYCGRHDRHAYELYLAINNTDHSKTKTKHPQTNGICERFHKTVLQEFYQVAFRKKIYSSLEQLLQKISDAVTMENLYHLGDLISFDGSLIVFRMVDVTRAFLEKSRSISGEDGLKHMISSLYVGASPQIRSYSSDYVESEARKLFTEHKNDELLGKFFLSIIDSERSAREQNRELSFSYFDDE